jgi:Mn2+/Fe2+ NRAMP family transporter
MVMLMVLARSRKVMGPFVVRGWLYGLGWVSTIAMAICTLGMVFSIGR